MQDKIGGISIGRIRKIFRSNDRIGLPSTRWFGVDFLQDKFGVSEDIAAVMIRQLQKLGYLSTEHDSNNYYSVTEKGKLFGYEKANRPITIEKADALYADFLGRIKTSNEDDDYLVKITGFFLFGEYVNGNDEITALEILLVHGEKDPNTFDKKKWEKINEHEGNLSVDQRATFAHNKVRKHLKDGSRYLSIYFYYERQNWPPGAKYFDAEGNYEPEVLQEGHTQKNSKKPDKKKPAKNEMPPEFIGRIIINERKERSSAQGQITRRHIEKEHQQENIHGQIQDGLISWLRIQYPECLVSPESTKMGVGSRIDIARKTKDDKIIFYEIKTYRTALISIRMAVGQLLEYAFYPKGNFSEEFYIVTHIPAKKSELIYLAHLSNRVAIKIGYIHYNCSSNQVEENISIQ